MANSISKTALELKILSLADATLNPLGLRIVDVDCRVGGRSLVRLFIERLDGVAETATCSMENCVEASRKISEQFDAIEAAGTELDWIPGTYDLEVSSPGLDRRLRLEADFEKQVGNDVKLKLNERLLPRGANLTGTLLQVKPETVVLKIDKDEVAVPLGQIKQANLIWRSPAN